MTPHYKIIEVIKSCKNDDQRRYCEQWIKGLLLKDKISTDEFNRYMEILNVTGIRASAKDILQ